MNPRSVQGAPPHAGDGAPTTTAERGGKGGGFAALLSQMGVNTKTAGDGAPGKDRRPPASPAAPAPAAPAALAPAALAPAVLAPATRNPAVLAPATRNPAVLAPAASAQAALAGQILPGPISRAPAQARPDAVSNLAQPVARPLQSPPSMSNNAAPSSFEAPRLVAKNRGVVGAGPEIRAEAPKARPELLTSDAPAGGKPAKVLTDGASRKSDAPTERPTPARILTTVSEPVVTQTPVSTARAATVSPVAHTRGEAAPVAGAPAAKLGTQPIEKSPVASQPAQVKSVKADERGHSAAPSQALVPVDSRGKSEVAPLVRPVASERPRPIFTKEEAARPAVKAEGERKVVEGERKVVAGERKVVAGERKVVEGERKVVEGERKIVEGERKIVEGERKVVEGERKVVAGERKVVAGQRKVVEGEGKVVDGERKVVEGERKVVDGERKVEVRAEAVKPQSARPVAKAEPAPVAVKTEAPAVELPVAEKTAPKAEAVAPARKPVEQVPARRAPVLVEPAPSAPAEPTVKQPAAEIAPVVVKAPLVPAQPSAKAAAPAQPAAEELPVATGEKAAAPATSEALPAAARKPAPARARGEAEIAAAPTAQPVVQAAAPVTPVAVRPAAADTAPAVTATAAVEQLTRAAGRPVVAAARPQVAGEPVELPAGERRKRPAAEKGDETTAEPGKTLQPGTPAPQAAPIAFERVAHRAAFEGQAKVESPGRRESEKESARTAEPAAASGTNQLLVPDLQHKPAELLPNNVPAFTAPVPQADAPPVAFAPAAAAPIVAHALEDPGLSVTVLPQQARVSVESTEGDLALHLRIRDGNAEISMGGSLAPMFEQRSAEVQTVLAGEGLSLGRFDLSDNNQQGQQAPREVPENDAAPARPATNHSAHSSGTGEEQPVRTGDGRIHVTA